MKLTDKPTQIVVPFASSGEKNDIPVNATQTTNEEGKAALDVGFPPITMTDISAGGIPPSGQDFNGIFNIITAGLRYSMAGGLYPYNAEFSSAIGGYPIGAILISTDGKTIWFNAADANTTDPDSTSSANWNSLTDDPGGLFLRVKKNLSDVQNKTTARENIEAYSVNGGEVKGEVWSQIANNYRIVTGDKGVFWRFDGENHYLMFTNSGEPNGGYNSLRPLYANFSTGDLSVGHNLNVGGNVTAGGSVYSGNGISWMATDGNVYGSVWDGYLNNWIIARANEAYNNANNWSYANLVQDIRLGSSSEFQERNNTERLTGGVMTSWADLGSSTYWIRLRPLQKCVGGTWYTVAYV